MKRIEPHWLWLGNAGDVENRTQLRHAQIAAYVDLAVTNEVLRAPREAVYCRYPLTDGPGNPRWMLRAAACAIADLIKSGTPTLVYCGAGLSRTPALAAAGISIVTGKPLTHCLRDVCVIAGGDVHPSLWNDVVAAVRESPDPFTPTRLD